MTDGVLTIVADPEDRDRDAQAGPDNVADTPKKRRFMARFSRVLSKDPAPGVVKPTAMVSGDIKKAENGPAVDDDPVASDAAIDAFVGAAPWSPATDINRKSSPANGCELSTVTAG